MFRKVTLSAILGLLILTVASCAAEEPKDETPEPAPVAAKPAEAEGPYYDLVKDEFTSKPDWTSKNVTLKGVKIGDKSKPSEFEEKLGKFRATDPVGDFYRAVSDGTKFAIYTQKMTGELQKIEIYTPYADQLADPKLKKLLSGGSLDYMREAFGKEDSADFNVDTNAEEFTYNAKGFRFAKYDLGGTKINSIIFSKLKPPTTN
jgi:hypothetical protein